MLTGLIFATLAAALAADQIERPTQRLALKGMTDRDLNLLAFQELPRPVYQLLMLIRNQRTEPEVRDVVQSADINLLNQLHASAAGIEMLLRHKYTTVEQYAQRFNEGSFRSQDGLRTRHPRLHHEADARGLLFWSENPDIEEIEARQEARKEFGRKEFQKWKNTASPEAQSALQASKRTHNWEQLEEILGPLPRPVYRELTDSGFATAIIREQIRGFPRRSERDLIPARKPARGQQVYPSRLYGPRTQRQIWRDIGEPE